MAAGVIRFQEASGWPGGLLSNELKPRTLLSFDCFMLEFKGPCRAHRAYAAAEASRLNPFIKNRCGSGGFGDGDGSKGSGAQRENAAKTERTEKRPRHT